MGLECIDYALVARLYFVGGIGRKEEKLNGLKILDFGCVVQLSMNNAEKRPLLVIKVPKMPLL